MIKTNLSKFFFYEFTVLCSEVFDSEERKCFQADFCLFYCFYIAKILVAASRLNDSEFCMDCQVVILVEEKESVNNIRSC